MAIAFHDKRTATSPSTKQSTRVERRRAGSDRARGEPQGSPEPRRATRSWTPRRVAVSALGLAVLLAAFAVAFLPYDRPLVGALDGRSVTVRATCAAPVQSAFLAGSPVLDSSRTFVGNPPCQESAAYRLGLAGLLGVGATIAAASARRHEQA